MYFCKQCNRLPRGLLSLWAGVLVSRRNHNGLRIYTCISGIKRFIPTYIFKTNFNWYQKSVFILQIIENENGNFV